MNITGKARRWIQVVAVAAIACGTFAADATGVAAAGTGWARFGHFAPSAAPVDVYVDGQLFALSIAFKNVSAYIELPAGPHEFSIKPAGQPDAASALTVAAGVPDGGAVTVSAVTTNAGIAPQVYDDVLSTPPTGQALVRFIHSAPDVPAVDVRVAGGGPVIASNVPYPSATAYGVIQPGQYDVDVTAAGSSEVLIHIAGWSIQPGVQSSIIIVRGLDGKLDVAPVLDSAAASEAPVGGVQTGYGGMSVLSERDASWSLWGSAALLAAAVLTIGAVSAARRHRRHSVC